MSQKLTSNSIREMERQLSQIKDVDILLEKILTFARQISNADAGSIYKYDPNTNKLTISLSHNDTKQKLLEPGAKLPYTQFTQMATVNSISGYSVLKNDVVNIADVYNLPEYLDEEKTIKRPFNFNQSFDLLSQYKSHSMLTIPYGRTDGTVLGAIQVINAQDQDGNIIPFSSQVESDILLLANHASSYLEQAYMALNMFERMAKLAALRDPKETGVHVERVSKFAVAIYDQYAYMKGIPMEQREKYRDLLALASKSHDFGKVAIADKILKKPGRFDDLERSIMKGHTCFGAQIFTPANSPLDEMCLNINLHHHDWYNGDSKGYPGNYPYMNLEPDSPLPEYNENYQTLKGNDIPLEARIASLADVYDALCHIRCYKPAWTKEDTIEEIKKARGTQFDPDLVDAFMAIKDYILDMTSKMDATENK